MISREQVEALKKIHGDHPNCGERELLDTLSAALEVVEAAKALSDRTGGKYKPLVEALAPFREEAK